MQGVGSRRGSGDPYRVLGVSAEASPRDIDPVVILEVRPGQVWGWPR